MALPSYRLEAISKFRFLTLKQKVDLENNIYIYSKIRHKISNLDKSLYLSVYNHKIDDIIYNLNPVNNLSLLYKIWNDEISISELTKLSFTELDPIKWKKMVDKRNNLDSKNKGPKTAVYQCRKCKSYNTECVQIQTRSADEPMTTFIDCLDCNCREKERSYKR